MACTECVSHLFTVFHILEHVDTVEYDGLQYILVVVHTVLDAGEVGRDRREKHLMVLWKTSVLTLCALHALLNMDSEIAVRTLFTTI